MFQLVFAKANFLYRLGRTEDSKEEYLKVKKTIEELNDAGLVRGGLEKNDSYQNVLQNLKKNRREFLKSGMNPLVLIDSNISKFLFEK